MRQHQILLSAAMLKTDPISLGPIKHSRAIWLNRRPQIKAFLGYFHRMNTEMSTHAQLCHVGIKMLDSRTPAGQVSICMCVCAPLPSDTVKHVLRQDAGTGTLGTTHPSASGCIARNRCLALAYREKLSFRWRSIHSHHYS